MTPCNLVGLLLASCVGQTAAMALFGRRQEPDHNATNDKRMISAYVLPKYIATIYSTGDVLKRKTAGFGFGFRMDYGHALWGFCPDNLVNEQECMIGACFDQFACSTGCLAAADTVYSTVTCTSGNAQFCSMAILTPQDRLPGMSYITCGGADDTDVYYGFTVDLLRTEESSAAATTTRSTPISTGTSETTPDSQQSPGAAITPPPRQSDIPSDPETSSEGSQSNSEGTTTNSNIGAIVGGAIGGLAVLCGFILAVVWLLRRNNNQAPKSPSSTLHEGKPELEAYERERDRERAELFGQGLSEMSARGPSAYDTASYGHNYPPMTPVELPVAHSPWKPTRV